MALLTVKKPIATSPGTPLTTGAASVGGDTFANTGREFIYINKTDAGSVVVTVTAAGTCNFGYSGAAHDLAVTCPASTVTIIGPLDPAKFNDANGLVKFTSATTGATVQVAAVSAI